MHKHVPQPGVIEYLSAAAAEERGLPTTMGPQFRAMERSGYDESAHTVTMALSSDKPVERSYGTEILSHEPGAIILDRLKRGIPLLFNHDMDLHLGISIGYEVSGGVLRVTNRFGGNPLALEKEGDVRSGILKDNSVGYMVYEWVITEDKTGHRTFLAVKWEPYEGSLVTVPADSKGSGVGRNSGEGEVPVKYTFRKMDDSEKCTKCGECRSECCCPKCGECRSECDCEDETTEAEAERAAAALATQTLETPAPPTPTASRSVMEPVVTEVVDVAAINATRVAGLRSLQLAYPTQFSERSLKDAETLGVSVQQVSERIFDAVVREAEKTDVPTIGSEILGRMTDKDLAKYSVAGAMRAAANKRVAGTFTGKDEGGFEREIDVELRKVAGERGITDLGAGVAIPSTASLHAARALRTITSAGNAGTATNFTTVDADPIPLLRYATAILALGATYLPGLKGAVQMTKQTGAATSSWLAEGAAISPSDPLFGFFTMRPNRLSMASSYTRDFLAQSNLAIESLLAADRNAVLARSLDTAALAGSGTNNIPKGLLNFTGLAAILSGSTRSNAGVYTAGAGAAPMTYVDYNNLEALISTANGAVSPLSILTTPKVKAAGRSTAKLPGFGSDVIWPDAPVGQGGMGAGPLGMQSLTTSNPVLTGFTSGAANNCHAVIMGAFAQILIGDWGLSEIIADNISGAATASMFFWEHGYYDVNNRHVESFAACTTVLPS